MVVQALDSHGATALAAARAEARLIRENAKRAPQGYPLRLHASGDARTDACAHVISEAAREWPGPVWCYTHAWRDVDRDSWQGVSILASIENADDGRKALRAGYAPALVVHEHPRNGRAWRQAGVTWIPCPEQTRGRQCIQCRLCFDADALKERRQGIAFAIHGNSAKRAHAAVSQLQLFDGAKRRLKVLR